MDDPLVGRKDKSEEEEKEYSIYKKNRKTF